MTISREYYNTPVVCLDGLVLTWLSDSTMSLSSGILRRVTTFSDQTQYFSSVSQKSLLTLDASVVGANGMDVGALGNSAWYAVHLIWSTNDKATPAGLISSSASDPRLPQNYDSFYRIGYIRTDGSADILRFWQKGTASERNVYWDEQVTVLNAQGSASPTYAAIDASAAMPPSAEEGFIRWLFVPQSVGNTFALRPNGSTATGNLVGKSDVVSVPHRGSDILVTNSSQAAQFTTTHANDDLSIFVMGYREYI